MQQISPTTKPSNGLMILGLFLAALFASAGSMASDKASRGEHMLQEVIAKNDIREMPSFEMKASLKIENYGHPVDGSYSLLWNGPDQWREEISLPGYSEIQVAGKDVISVKRTTEYKPWQIKLVHDLLSYDQDLKLRENEKIKQIHDREIRGIKVSCIEIAGKVVPRQVCIDPSSGALVREMPFVDGDLTSVGGKEFPFSLSYIDHAKSLVEARITELKTPMQFPISAFDPPAGGVSTPKCDGNDIRSGKLVARVQPAYPVQQRLAHVEGTVQLYAVIGSDGLLHNLEVVSSVDPALDSSALQAVHQWRYEPYMCKGVPVEVETVVQVNYSLAR